MMMIGDMTGDFIRSMPVTVVVALLASLFISLTLTPFLSNRFLRIEAEQRRTVPRRLLDHIIENNYQRRLQAALRKPYHYLGGAIVVFLLSLLLLKFFIGVSFFPKAEKPQLIININTPSGTNLDKTTAVASYVESILLRRPEVKHFATNIGRGNPRIYYNVIPENEKSTHAQILVELKRYDPGYFAELIRELREEFRVYPGAEIEVKEFEQGPPIEAPIAIRIIGDNLDSLKKIAHDAEQIIASTEGTININNPLRTSATDLQVKINRAKAGMLGIPLVDIDRAVRASLAGLPISDYRDPEGKEYQIVVRLPIQDNPSYSDFDKIYIASVTGSQVPLKQVASIEFAATPMEIDHHNLDRNVTLTSDVIGGMSVNATTKKVMNKLDQYDWPKGYRYAVGGELESQQESFGGMMQAVIIAMVSIFAVLVLQFRSYSQPLIVFSAIPLALVGSVLALLITGFSFSFTAFVGLTSLVGIVVNNSIILVDYSNQLRADGKTVREAVIEAGKTRFIPIFLTTGTTIVGLIPLTLGGGSLWAPLGWTLMGGLTVSTILTLLIVPILYTIFTREKTAENTVNKN
jgi:multidrug efflux pump subunit AcrB